MMTEPHTLKTIRIHPTDNVIIALKDLSAGERLSAGEISIVLKEPVKPGHKIALISISAFDKVIKYGHVIGHATGDIQPGEWVHSHNLATDLSGELSYTFKPGTREAGPESASMPGFMGYRRSDGRVGIRNDIWVINTVGCVNSSAERIARICNERFGGKGIDGVYTFAHPYGCSQLGDDLGLTRRILAGLMRNPNAGGILLMGLGCENNQMEELLEIAGNPDPARLRRFYSQKVGDEIEAGIEAVGELYEIVKNDRRVECPFSDLVIGLNCGGSDGFSGISANPLLGQLSDRLSAWGGIPVLTEVPEMFGAEQQLMNRARDRRTFEELVAMINGFKQYFIRHHQPVYENPSPGNKEGGLTTLEEKSLGAIQKGGSAPVAQILDYGVGVDLSRRGGLALINSPGNDGVSTTAQVASGAALMIFTTGRGTPLGTPVPTVKVSSNSAIYHQKPHWIDFNAGALLDGEVSMPELTRRFIDYLVAVASGEKRTNNEINDYREIAIWKEGVTL
ncbi:MAG TPA: altronate dehydratase family protein [Calditrichia bacterium]|nr:altronate dehydratase [Calditrichota bacterium]HQV32875.1 altronate dehydratase family protein [Calditrichia bacterium]